MELIFLMLSDAMSEAARNILRLRDIAVASGLRARIATHPLELVEARSCEGVTVAVIDGVGASDHDVFWLAGVLRSVHRVAVIMLVPDTSAARSRALLAGADLCLSLPIEGAEFRAAVCAVTRRVAAEPAAPDAPAVGGATSATVDAIPPHEGRSWRLVGKGWTLVSPQGHRIDLTATERGLVQHLFMVPRGLVSHQDLVKGNVVFARRTNEGRRAPLAGVVSRLKKKCRAQGVALPILSSRGKGYRFAGDCIVGE